MALRREFRSSSTDVAPASGHRLQTTDDRPGIIAASDLAMSDTLLDFPTDFPLKIMGRNTHDFRSLVVGIVQKHAGDIDPASIEERLSRDRNYVGLTVTIRAESKEQLDALYVELTSCEKVLIVL
jgi:putative lipoic acid-binding regulatory protein